MQDSFDPHGQRSLRSRGRAALAHALLPEKSDARVSQFEVEQDLQRFTSSFFERISEAAEHIAASPQADQREAALRRTLNYCSAALAIVSGPRPELNLLDMLVFVSLCRDTFERYWLKEVFGEAALPMYEVLKLAADDVWHVSRKLLTPEDTALLRELITNFQDEHPEQVRVEGLRFSEFAGLATNAREKQRASGLVASVYAATRTADQAVLLGERFMFLVHRLPVIWRLEARVGALDMLADSASKLSDLSSLLPDAGELRAMLGEIQGVVPEAARLIAGASELADKAERLSHSAMPLMHSIERLLLAPHEQRAQRAILASDTLTGKAQRLLDRCTALTGEDPAAALSAASARLERNLQRIVWQLAALGAGLIVLFWCGYYLARAR